MFKSKKTVGAFALSLLVTNAFAQPIEEELLSQEQVQAYMLGSPFNYVTINELLSIDEKKALENERKEADKIGLTQTRGMSASLSPLQTTKHDADEGTKAEVSGGRSEQEKSKGLSQKNDDIEKSPAEQALAFNPELVGIYGVGSQLSAMFRYGGFSYMFVSGQKQNQRANNGNSLSLVSIGDRCLSVYDNEIKTQVKACLGEAN